MSFVRAENLFQSYGQRPILERINISAAEGESAVSGGDGVRRVGRCDGHAVGGRSRLRLSCVNDRRSMSSFRQ